MSSLGVILAGGQSTRMGLDKAQVELGGKTLLTHCHLRLAQQLPMVALNSNDPNPNWSGARINDLYPDQMGPLLGVLSALNYAQNAGYDSIITVPIDAPFFPPDLVEKLSKPTADIVLAAGEDPNPRFSLQPTFGRWSVAMLAPLQSFLNTGQRKVMAFVTQHDWQQVTWPSQQPDPFFNINTPQDLQIAQSLLETTP